MSSPQSKEVDTPTLAKWFALQKQLLAEREMERLVRLEELRKEIAIGIEASDRGEVFDGEEVLNQLRQEIDLTY